MLRTFRAPTSLRVTSHSVPKRTATTINNTSSRSFTRSTQLKPTNATRTTSVRPTNIANRHIATRFASTLKFTKEHEWIKVEDNIGTVGITAFAQNALGDVVYVDLPEVGRKVQKKDNIVAVESVKVLLSSQLHSSHTPIKAASDVYAPVSGEVIAVNEALSKEPAAVNKSPFGDGWMVKLKLANMQELDELLDEVAYKKHCEVETH